MILNLENRLWGIHRIHGERRKLGYNLSQSTAYRYLQNLRMHEKHQNWKTFLRNNTKEILSIDFLTILTINIKMLYVFIIVEHRRIIIIHFNVTEHPTSFWTAQQRQRSYEVNFNANNLPSGI